MTKETPREFFDRISRCTSDQMWVEIKSLCKALKIHPNAFGLYQSCGLKYTLDHLAAEAYLSADPIDPDIRFRLITLSIFEETNVGISRSVFDLNQELSGKMQWEWDRPKLTEKRDEMIKLVRAELQKRFPDL